MKHKQERWSLPWKPDCLVSTSSPRRKNPKKAVQHTAHNTSNGFMLSKVAVIGRRTLEGWPRPRRDRLIPACLSESDASGSWGCGAWYGHSWFQLQWDNRSAHLPIMVKELLPIFMAWGPTWSFASATIRLSWHVHAPARACGAKPASTINSANKHRRPSVIGNGSSTWKCSQNVVNFFMAES